MSEGYTTYDIGNLFSISRNTIQSNIDRRFIVPSIYAAKRQGEKNLFSKNDLYHIFHFLQMIRMGIPRREASTLSDNVDWNRVSQHDHSQVIVFSITIENGEWHHYFECCDVHTQKEFEGPIIKSVINLLAIKDFVEQCLKREKMK